VDWRLNLNILSSRAGFVLLLLGLFHYCRASLTSCSISERRSQEIDYILKNKSIIPSFSKALIKPVLNLAAILCILLWAGWQVLPSALAFRYGVRPPVYAVRKQNDTTVVTSDGVALSTEIYHPLHLSKNANNSCANSFDKVTTELVLGRCGSKGLG